MTGFLEALASYQLFLASRSPRRKQLLQELGLPFQVWIKEEVEEEFPKGISKEEVALFLARIKAQPYLPDLKDHQILITADTIVCQQEEILGKPLNAFQAREMLRFLSGNVHEVITGVCLSGVEKSSCFQVTTRVSFAALEEDEISYYVDTYQPYDKAGSYGIQEWIGLVGVNSIEGSYFNVMGLPVQRLYQEIKSFINYNPNRLVS